MRERIAEASPGQASASSHRPDRMTTYARRDDADLVSLARAGDRAAFAVLVDRTLPDVWATVSRGTADVRRATRAAQATYTDAMLALSDRGRDGPVADWITALARRYAPADAPTSPLPLPAGLEDAVWRELDRRWPDGRAARRHAVPWGRIGVVVGLVLAAALLPVAFLGVPDSLGTAEPLPDATVEATPVEDPDPEPSPTPAGPLPDFTFPTPPAEGEPAVSSADTEAAGVPSG